MFPWWPTAKAAVLWLEDISVVTDMLMQHVSMVTNSQGSSAMAGRYFRGDQHVHLAHISMATNSQSSRALKVTCVSVTHVSTHCAMPWWPSSKLPRRDWSWLSHLEKKKKCFVHTHFTPTHPKILTKEKRSLIMSSLMQGACTFVHVKISTIHTCRLRVCKCVSVCKCVCVCVNSRYFNLCLNLFICII